MRTATTGEDSITSLAQSLSGLEWVAGAELGEQREVAVSRQQLVHTVRDTYRGDPGIVDDPSDHTGPLCETAQNPQEIVCLANQTNRRGRGPRG